MILVKIENVEPICVDNLDKFTPAAQILPTLRNISKTPIRAFYIKKSSYTIHRCFLSVEKTQSSGQSRTII